MKKKRSHIQTPSAHICRCKFERMRILSELRASLYEAICKVDEEIASIRRIESRNAQRFHRDNKQTEIPTKNRRGESRGSIADGKTGQNFPVWFERDYHRIARSEL